MSAIKNLKVSVLGAGSIGCYVGGYLQSVGCQVTFIGRSRVKWDVDLRGLTLTHYRRKPIDLRREDMKYEMGYDNLDSADVILICVKSQDTAAIAETIAENLTTTPLLISLQNGVNNQHVLEHQTGLLTLGAIVPFNVTPVHRGEFHCGTEGKLLIEASDDSRLATVVKAFRKSKMGAKTTPNIADYQWGKLLVNLNNALSALSGGTLREGLSQKDYRLTLAAMMEEGLEICQGAGLNPKTFGKASIHRTISILRLPNIAFGPIMSAILKIDANARSSMLDDLEGGKDSEVDFLQGEIVRLATSTGQYAQINGIVLQQVYAAFKAHQSPNMSGQEMLELIQGNV